MLKKQCLATFVALMLLFSTDVALCQNVSAEKSGIMVVAANPKAVKAGYQVLQNGGNALDAAIAVQMLLTLVEPQSSGIGGGAFLLYWDNKTKKLHAYDGRETAPATARADRFLLPNGHPQDFYQAVVGGLSVGVPGVLAMLEKSHQAHGLAPWPSLFSPAIKLAKRGFVVSPRLRDMLEKDRFLRHNPKAGNYFYDDKGKPKSRLVNLPLAKTLNDVANGGSRVFYEGELAKAIVDTVKNATPSGDLTLDDLKSYESIKREPICSTYRSDTVCSMPPPTSGGIALLQMLGILENFSVKEEKPDSAKMVHLFTQAQRLAFADRNQYVADADFVTVPVAELLEKEYLQKRAELIQLDKDMGNAQPGKPLGQPELDSEESKDYSLPSTSHISIVDGWGNAVSMTTSVENGFGSRLMVDGFLLNNQLTDFSFLPTTKNKDKAKGDLIANRVEPGKRPRSSMTPAMVFDANGALKVVAGSPGGSKIIGYVARTIWSILEWNLDPKTVVAAPNFGNTNGVTTLEAGTPIETLKEPLEAMGHEVVSKKMESGLNVITIDKKGMHGGTDPRREGIIITDRH
ncbi:MAG: gamma-glutamyltransferase [Magnetococcales bacterium]|nr:gamma-glutamyltransferase [Magnetococcales bacterium]